MQKFLKIKIYRRKFFLYLILVVLTSVGLEMLTCFYFINNWLNNYQQQALLTFTRIEKKLKGCTNQADSYVLHMYSNSDLMNDVSCFLSKSPEEYLTTRLKNSRYNKSLSSFPNDIKDYFSGSAISQLSLHTDESANVIHFFDDGSTSLEFGVPNDNKTFKSNVMQGFVYSKKLYDPEKISKQIGEMRFLISSQIIFGSSENDEEGSALAVDNNNGVYVITSGMKSTDSIIRQIKKSNNNQGSFNKGVFNKVFYVVYRSDQFNYKFVYTIDLYSIARCNSGQLLFIAAVFFALIIIVMTLLVLNLKYDAAFLGQIIETINNVKVGNFKKRIYPRYRNNEYGMIARELNDMSLELEKYIRTEYILKLKQQEAEMRALQNQINPHFLYNALETIRSLALVNHDETAAEFASNLGGMYRDIVKSKSIISLDEELQLLKKYLSIMECRYPDNFYYQINVPSEMLKIKTIKLWMQPLAENFFKHGFNHNNQFNLLIVNGREEENNYVLEIIDNGRHISDEQVKMLQNFFENPDEYTGENIGIKNVYMRLRFFMPILFQ